MDSASLNLFATIASAVAATASVLVAVIANRTTKETHKSQQRLEQRAMIVTLWPEMCKVGKITASSPETHVRDAVNVLELVAICWEAKAVDQDVILRTFGDAYVATYNELMSHHVKMPGVRDRTGAELLQENKAAMLVYEEIKKLLLNQGKVR